MAHLRASTNASTIARTGAATAVNPMRSDTIRRVAGLDESEARFSLHGEFDIADKWQLYAALRPSTDYQTLTIDLAHATFIDAGILGVFVHVARRRRAIGATRLRIVNLSTHFRRIFRSASWTTFLTLTTCPRVGLSRRFP